MSESHQSLARDMRRVAARGKDAPAAFERLHVAFKGQVLLAIRYVLNPNYWGDDIQLDVAQDFWFEKIWKRADKYNGSPVERWLISTAKNFAIDYSRPLKHQPPQPDREHRPTNSGVDYHEPDLSDISLQNAIKDMTTHHARCLAIINRSVLGNESIAELAKREDVTERTARQLKYQCVRRFRAYFEDPTAE